MLVFLCRFVHSYFFTKRRFFPIGAVKLKTLRWFDPSNSFSWAFFYPIDETLFINQCAVLKRWFHKLSVLEQMYKYADVMYNASMYNFVWAHVQNTFARMKRRREQKKPGLLALWFEYIKHKYTAENKSSCIDSIMRCRLAGHQSKTACTGGRQHVLGGLKLKLHGNGCAKPKYTSRLRGTGQTMTCRYRNGWRLDSCRENSATGDTPYG